MFDMRSYSGSQDGAITVVTAGVVLVSLFFLALVIVVGQWFVHDRHLQTQVDAAALAGATEFGIPCAEGPDGTVARVREQVEDYYGKRFNAQVDLGNADVSDVVLDEAAICSATPMVDVKGTDTVNGLMDIAGDVTVSAQARVEFLTAEEIMGNTPIAVTNSTPQKAWAVFVDEDNNGEVLASTPLSQVSGTAQQTWANATTVSVPLGGRRRVGVRIVLSGKNSTSVPSCTELLVTCYDATNTARGLSFIHVYSGVSTAAKATPQVRSASLEKGTCLDPYFSSPTATCTVALKAAVDFGPTDPTGATFGARLQAVVAGKKYPLTYASGTWRTDSVIPVAPGAGALPIELQWAETAGLKSGTGSPECTTGGNGANADPFNSNKNPCTGTFGTVQRTFAAPPENGASGPISAMSVNGPMPDAHDLRCDDSTCAYPLSVSISLDTGGTLQPARNISDPPYVLINPDLPGNQTQLLDCDPDRSRTEELVGGCEPFYTRNVGSVCPKRTSLQAMPQPWSCVAIDSGLPEIAAGLNERILGDPKASECTSPNNFRVNFGSQYLGDPRRVQLLVTPFGSFNATGTDETVPVSDLATFYITGWKGKNGQGFDNPCQNAFTADDPLRDDTRPGENWVLGYFLKVASDPDTTVPGSSACNPLSLTTCVGVLTR